MPFLRSFLLLGILCVVGAQDPPILQAPVNTPTLIQTFIVNPRFAPCLTASSNTDGAPVILKNCGTRNTDDIKWTVVEGGAVESTTPDPGPITPIKIFDDKCLDVPNGNNTVGVQLQIWTCGDTGGGTQGGTTGNAHQKWQVNGDGSISWAGSDKCLAVTSGGLADGNPVQLSVCSQTDPTEPWNAVPPSQ